jgi:predicted phosphodiesterase
MMEWMSPILLELKFTIDAGKKELTAPVGFPRPSEMACRQQRKGSQTDEQPSMLLYIRIESQNSLSQASSQFPGQVEEIALDLALGGPQSMLILHLSDIHFHYPACASEIDPDRPFRTRLFQDARERAESLGDIDAILVGGDIAFAGKPEEYVEALKWLYELADACRCKRERIYVIPGNHDIDRQIIIKNLAVQNAQQAIIRATDKERELARQLRHKDTGPALLAPLSAYNDFAVKFWCEVFAPEKLFWHQDVPLADGVQLRIYGLTSTILSGAGAPNDKNDEPRDLYLSPQQTVLNPVDNVVNLVMCHHPPDWLLDGDRAADDISGRTSIHLFGHKHRQRIHRDRSHVAFYAGAVNPDRQERDWKPGYNIIRLSLGKDARGDFQLEVEAHLLEWQTNPEMFKPILDDDYAKSDVHRAEVRLRNIRVPAPTAVAHATATFAVQQVDAETAMGEERAKNIVLRFWDLTMSDRREISQTLHLLEPDEMNLPQPERYGRALLRAGQRNLLEELAGEIEKREKR